MIEVTRSALAVHRFLRGIPDGHLDVLAGAGAAVTKARLKEVKQVKTWFVLGSAAAVAAVAVALLAGKDDIRRFRQMRNM